MRMRTRLVPAAAKVDVHVHEPGEEREIVVLENLRVCRNVQRRTSPGRRNPPALDDDRGSLHRVAAGAVDESLGDDDECWQLTYLRDRELDRPRLAERQRGSAASRS
jgi:hypothetical protein